MGVGIDTVVAVATNPGAAGAAAVPNGGDSLTIRAFPSGAFGRLHMLTRQGATEGFALIKSPRLHDSSRGIQIISAETPAITLLPQEIGQPMYAADTLTVNVSGGAAEVDGLSFGVYYSDLPGIAARVFHWAQLAGHVVNYKPIEVDVAANAVSGAWTDTSLTATENLLKADTYYAILGYVIDVGAMAVGIRGPETGNLRLCGPGTTLSYPTVDHFLKMSMYHNLPYIPVINANNRNNISVSTALISVAATPKVVLSAVELSQAFQP